MCLRRPKRPRRPNLPRRSRHRQKFRRRSAFRVESFRQPCVSGSRNNVRRRRPLRCRRRRRLERLHDRRRARPFRLRLALRPARALQVDSRRLPVGYVLVNRQCARPHRRDRPIRDHVRLLVVRDRFPLSQSGRSRLACRPVRVDHIRIVPACLLRVRRCARLHHVLLAARGATRSRVRLHL
jgi:hypothetical protein